MTTPPEHPFPMPHGPERMWSHVEHQRAANHYWYEVVELDRTQPNYRPILSLLQAAFARHSRYARRLRAEQQLTNEDEGLHP